MSYEPRDGHDSRTDLIVTAIRLFAEQGIAAVSVRAVNRAAGLAAAAVHYHFGSKDALLDEAVAFHADDAVDAINAACDQLLDSGSPPTPYDLVAAFGSSYDSLLRRFPASGRNWVAMIAQLLLSDETRISELAKPVTHKLEALARLAFPDAPVEQVRLALGIAFVTFIRMVVQEEWSAQVEELGTTTVARFLTGGLVAVLSREEPVSKAVGAA